MPQEFQVLRCFSCETFQVDIVKKKNVKWECKLCRFKQSIKHVYTKSFAAKECRALVQSLNLQRGNLDEYEDANRKENSMQQQTEILNEISFNPMMVENDKQNLEEGNHSLDTMTSPNVKTSRILFSTLKSNNGVAAYDDGLKVLKSTEDNIEPRRTISKWSKYLVIDEEDE